MIELHVARTRVFAHVAAVVEPGLRLRERLAYAGSCEVAVVFLGERYLGQGNVASDHEGSVVMVTELYPTNARSAPRVAVDLAGTYYLRPPAVGVPMRVVDISISGLAIEPITGQQPARDELRMCSFGIGGREIKAVVAFVEITQELWRASFVKLGLSDEEAIAALVLHHQLSKRKQLSSLEVGVVSPLDLEDRLRYPLIERIDLGPSEVTYATSGVEVVVANTSPEPLAAGEFTDLVGWLRCGDLRDLNHALGVRGLSELSIDLVLTGCLALTGALGEIAIVDVLARLLDIEINEEQRRCSTLVPVSIQDTKSEGTTLVETSGRRWERCAYAAGVALFLPAGDGELQDHGRVDPLTMAQLLWDCDGQVLLVPNHHETGTGVRDEILGAFRSLARGEVCALRIDD